jgi:MFS family permease
MVAPASQRSGAAFGAAAFALATGFVGSNLPTPLYPVYQERWHFSAAVVTIIYAGYSVGLIASLVGIGRLSDQLGRRRVLVPALTFILIASFVFLFARNVKWLIFARLIQGLGVGAATGTASAALADFEPENNQQHAALAGSMATAVGLSLGPLIGGLIVDAVPHPDSELWGFYILLVAGALLAVRGTMPKGRLESGVVFRLQHVSLPRHIIVPFLASAGIFLCGWVATALFLALGPTFVISLLHIQSRAVGGFVGFTVFAASAIIQLGFLRSAIPYHRLSRAMTLGVITLLTGLTVFVFSIAKASIGLFLGGVLLVGFGQGISYFASLAALNAITPLDRRGEVMAAYYLVGYIAVGTAMPAVGFGSMRIGLPAACGILTAVLAILAAASATAAHLRLKGQSKNEEKS